MVHCTNGTELPCRHGPTLTETSRSSNSLIRQTLSQLENGLLSDLQATTHSNGKLLEDIASQQLMVIESLTRRSNAYTQTAITSSTGLPRLPPPENQQTSSSDLLSSFSPSRPRTMLLTDKCDRVCTCTCHRPCKTATPVLLRSALGQAHIRYTAAGQSGKFCNERLCRRQRGYELRLTYKLPSWLTSRVLSLSLTSLSDGLSMVIRVPRIVADDAPILRFAAARDLQSIQALIGRGLASPADVGHSYGLTALHVRLVTY